MRLYSLLAAAVVCTGLSPAAAQRSGSRSAPSRSAPSRADSALVARVLAAEDRRDPVDRSLVEGVRSADPRVRTIAWRAKARIADPHFAARDSLPPLPKPPTWPEPAWRLHFRALTAQRLDCAALLRAMADSAWAVRLRAADLAQPPCADNAPLVATLRQWADALPADASTRKPGEVSWHAAAHALLALARVQPADARARMPMVSSHRQWQARLYAARAAGVLGDTTTLRALARDENDNVREAAIDALSKLTGHADDELYLGTLRRDGAQAVRAAARALKGSPRADVSAMAMATFERWVARDNASAHDVRAALLEAAGRPATDDRAPASVAPLPARAVSLALGENVALRVTMSPASGGGTFDVRLRGDVAPIMAARVLALAGAGYYDNLTWHRVEPDFVIQGGSPGASEYVGWSQALRDELGTVPHLRGTVGMSTRGHDTGDAQWFVNLRDNLRLGADYTVFGEVTRGIDVVDGILEGDVIESIRELPPAQRGR